MRRADLMETLNHALFLRLNAATAPDALTLELAILLAVRLVYAVPLLIALGWLRGAESTRKTMLTAAVSALLGLLASWLIGRAWPQPRPFAIDLGHLWIPHAANASFPSNHLTFWWAVACAWLLQPGWRAAGAALALAGLPLAWARIYLGVHFPLDMLGAFVVALCSAWLAQQAARWYLAPLYRLAKGVHRRLFGPLITRGWVRE